MIFITNNQIIFVVKGTKYFFLQFSDGLWLDCPGEQWSGLGLVEAIDQKYIIDWPTMDSFMSRLPMAIQRLEVAAFKGKREDYLVALNGCLGDALPRFTADLRIYLEACKISHHSAGTVRFLITQHYKFFVRSVDVEECLGRLAKETLSIPCAVTVQLAGEVIKD